MKLELKKTLITLLLLTGGISTFAADNYKVKINLNNLGNSVKGAYMLITDYKTKELTSENTSYTISGKVK